MAADTPRKELSQEWYNYQYAMELRVHLRVLSQVVIEGNTSAALQFALQSEGIIEDGEYRRANRTETGKSE